MVFRILIYAGFIYAILLIASHVFILTGLAFVFRTKVSSRSGNRKYDKKISVIIPARNEENNLPRLFSTLENQSFSDFEIILVDDRSEDNTLSVMEEFQSRHPERIKIVRNTETFYSKNPKQMVLDLGAKEADGEILLFTDADCSVPETWVESLSKQYSDEKIGLVFGAVSTGSGKGLLANFQRFDHILRYHYTAACAGLNNPTGGFGNNLSIRAKALSEIGGFSDIEFSVTEDAQLIARVRNSGNWKIKALSSWDSTVFTTPVSSWKELVLQELRWSTGAVHAPDWEAKVGYGFVMYQLATGILALIPAFTNPFLFSLFFAGIISMLVVSTAAGINLGMDRKYWIYLIPSLITAEFLFPVIVLWAVFKPVIIWKGEKVGRGQM